MRTATTLAGHILEVTPGQIRSSKRHKEKSVAYDQLRKMRLLPETRYALTKAAQKSCACCLDQDCGSRVKRLSAACHDVYAVIRTAMVRGYAGALISGRELSKWLRISERAVWYSVRKLRALKLLSRVKHFENREYTNMKTGKLYGVRKAKSSYLTGSNAPGIKVREPKDPTASIAVGTLLQKLHKQPSLRKGEGGQPTAAPHSTPTELRKSIPAPATCSDLAGLDLEFLDSAELNHDGDPNRVSLAPTGAPDAGTEERLRMLDDLDLSFLDSRPQADKEAV